MAKLDEARLVDAIATCVFDPLRFVMLAYPWGEPGPLAHDTGPDEWQRMQLVELGEALKAGRKPRFATSSGHGVGKSALVAWVAQWFLSTRPHPQVIITANTKEQLLKKTFRELSVWHKRMINEHWFNWTATKFYHVDHPSTWFANAATWSETRTEAFAGTHEAHVMLIFDEASAIIDKVWEVAEGALTTDSAAVGKSACWLAFGNPTRNSGAFFDCFTKMKHRWRTFRVDSRTAKMTDKELIKQWIEDYGEDSDFVRVRVKGEAPRAASTQFFETDIVERAMGKGVPNDPDAVKVLSADPARFGVDQSVVGFRTGQAVAPFRKFRGIDTMQFAAIIAEEIERFQPDATFVDGNGLGAGVVDRLRQLNYRVFEVLGQSAADDPRRYCNKRAEMYGRAREWLKGDASLPADEALKASLPAIEYGYNAAGAIQIESKADLKSRGLPSPDEVDCWAMGFAEPVRAARRIIIPEEYRREWRPPRRREAPDWRAL